MDIQQFIAELEAGLQGAVPGLIRPETVFRELPIWDSLAALTMLSVVDSLFGFQMSAERLRSCRTVQEVFDLATRLRPA